MKFSEAHFCFIQKKMKKVKFIFFDSIIFLYKRGQGKADPAHKEQAWNENKRQNQKIKNNRMKKKKKSDPF